MKNSTKYNLKYMLGSVVVSIIIFLALMLGYALHLLLMGVPLAEMLPLHEEFAPFVAGLVVVPPAVALIIILVNPD